MFQKLRANPFERAMPCCVRRKALEAGLELLPEHWRALPVPARQRLAQLTTDDGVARASYAGLVRWLLRTFGGGLSARAVETDWAPGSPPWSLPAPPPGVQVVLGRSGRRWDDLGPDARFVILEVAGQGDEALLNAVGALRSPARCEGLPCIET